MIDKEELYWISLEAEPNNLPDNPREVLVVAYWHERYQRMIGGYWGDGVWWCAPFNNTGEHMQRLHVTHWRELPPPPKGV